MPTSSSSKPYDVLIVGAGCAGLAAGMYAGRFGLRTAVIGELPGGTITLTHIVENYPGFVSLTGQELADNLLKHMQAYDVPLLGEKALSVKKIKEPGPAGSKPPASGPNGDLLEVTTDTGTHYSRTLIAATGTEWKKLNVPGEKEFANKGVHYCALCDGAFYKNKVIATVGSGDSAAKEGLYLADLSSRAYILTRGPALHGEPIHNERVSQHPKLTVFNGITIKEILGSNGKATGLKLSKPVPAGPKGAGGQPSGPLSDILPVDAVFVEIGHAPITGWLSGLKPKLNAKGEIAIDRLSRTSVPGLFAAGDVCDTEFKQAITGTAEGVTAAYSAYEFVSKKELSC